MPICLLHLLVLKPLSPDRAPWRQEMLKHVRALLQVYALFSLLSRVARTTTFPVITPLLCLPLRVTLARLIELPRHIVAIQHIRLFYAHHRE
eukprot:765925-Hanusia_phi.AAC.2